MLYFMCVCFCNDVFQIKGETRDVYTMAKRQGETYKLVSLFCENGSHTWSLLACVCNCVHQYQRAVKSAKCWQPHHCLDTWKWWKCIKQYIIIIIHTASGQEWVALLLQLLCTHTKKRQTLAATPLSGHTEIVETCKRVYYYDYYTYNTTNW